MNIRFIIGVDPGNPLGLACIDIRPKDGYSHKILFLAQISTDGKNYEEKLIILIEKFYELLENIKRKYELKKKNTRFIIERPFYNPENLSVAESGSLVKLSLTAGAIVTCITLCGFNSKFISVRKWKGQTPKKVTHKRIFQRMEELKFRKQVWVFKKDFSGWKQSSIEKISSSHIKDAIGIALHNIGVMF